MVLKTFKAKMGLKMHLRSSRHYARHIRILGRRANYNKNERRDSFSKLNFALKKGNVHGIYMCVQEYIETCKKEIDELNEIVENVFILESRLEKELNKTIKDLDKLKNNEKVWSNKEVKDSVDTIHKLMRYTKRKINNERRDVRRLKHGIRKEKRLLPDITLFHEIKIYSRREKREVRQVDNLFNDIQKILHQSKKGNLNEEKIKQIAKDIDKLKHDIIDEMKGFLKIEKAAIVMMERTKKEDLEAINNEIKELHKKHVPMFHINKFREMLKEVNAHIYKQEVLEESRTKALRQLAH